MEDITSILEQTGMEPALLELEITESMLMQNIEKGNTGTDRTEE
ncbi:hypothetical protein ACFS07_16260 [Undibacterium arcticum]